MKLDSENNENKILLLYTLSKIGRPISHNEFLELVSSITDMNYFVFQEFILDLIEDGYVISYKENGIDMYEITEEGKKDILLTINLIPGILKLQIDSKFKKNLNTINDKYSVSAEYIPINEKEFLIKCRIIEHSKLLFSLELSAGSKTEAKNIVENWNKNAGDIYPQILDLIEQKETKQEELEQKGTLSDTDKTKS